MENLVVLLIEPEQPEGISARKLVLETAKHNVISAYSPEVGLKLLRRFPLVSAVVLHGSLPTVQQLLGEVKAVREELSTVVLSPDDSRRFPGADYVISSHNPQDLLRLLANELNSPGDQG